jgi:hypothetical protein
MKITYDVEVPAVKSRAGKYKTLVLGILATKKDNMKIEFDTEKEAQSFVGFCNSDTGKKLNIAATQREKDAYCWKVVDK